MRSCIFRHQFRFNALFYAAFYPRDLLSSLLQMVRRFRLFEKDALASGARSARQLIVAVTANGSELSDGGASGGFDQVCPKPLSVKEIYHLVQKYFQ